MHIKNLRQRILIGGLAVVLAGLMALAAGCTASKGVAERAGEKTAGSYTVVGIGPGDADLLTVRAAEAIAKADMVFCNSKTREKLAPAIDFSGKEVVEGYNVLFRYYKRDCKAASKEKKNPKSTCEDYHKKQAEFAAMVREAVTAGKDVVLLSGGDPTIYGPDMWTVKELAELSPTVIPGLSSFNAANAALQVSLGEVMLTAPFKKAGSLDSIEDLARHDRATMVIFMPRNMTALFARLANSYPADTPVAIVGNAGMAGRETVTMGTVGGFAVDTSVIENFRSIVYVGKALARATFKPETASNMAGKGKYYLVGVGPGDPDLITLRGLEVIKEADVIFAHQRLRDKFKAELAGKEVITGFHRLFPFYGKSCSKVAQEGKRTERMSCEDYHKKQEEFSALVREAVAQGKTVAMLDSGDPLVYGPCAWSLTELRDLDTEVVPGVSCFNAANAALKAGVTEGETSHSVLLASGWSVNEMAVHQSTMVLFTMRTQFKKFIDALSAHYAADTPVAIVFSAGYAEDEKVLHGTLGTIMEQVGAGKLPFQYLLYVGDFLSDGGRVAH